MFAYRHAFHAGNHADVLKHIALVSSLGLLKKKETPFLVIDTHAGAGLYTLHSPLVRDKAEWSSGIGRLWPSSEWPEPIAHYMDVVRAFNKSGRLTHYPGSPLITQMLLRDDDRLRAFELHPSDIGPLQAALRGRPRQLKAERKDGFQQLRALLPPPTRRGLVLIDPPYEMRADYGQVVKALRESLTRFATGVYMIWYPIIARYQVERLLRHLASCPIHEVLHAQLSVRSALRDGLGLQGSGVVVVNPPFGLADELAAALPVLAKALGQDKTAGYRLAHGANAADVKTALGMSTPSAVVPPSPGKR